ncbi:hypothetical protein [Paraburkholderia sp. RL17-381-BIF-C]|jgi:hypothetical protein|uniref:hypothetical protein n=1 Tax=Paraburkholderia sp. RL17-381-BIF-C TaxID=3031635 RepID=UPI0038BD7DB9
MDLIIREIRPVVSVIRMFGKAWRTTVDSVRDSMGTERNTPSKWKINSIIIYLAIILADAPDCLLCLTSNAAATR